MPRLHRRGYVTAYVVLREVRHIAFGCKAALTVERPDEIVWPAEQKGLK